MKTDFKFSNLLGTVYRKGNLCFTPDGTCLLSPVGNRVTVFNLVQDISCLAIHPRGNLLLTIDDNGRAILSNISRRIILHYFTFKGPVSALCFSPAGTHFAVGIGRFVEAWRTPEDSVEQEFAPFVLHHRHAGHHDAVESISWSSDSRFFITSSSDLTTRIWSLNPEDGFKPTVLAAHRQGVCASWFSDDQETIYTVSRDGALFHWKYVALSEEAAAWRVISRNYFLQDNAHVTCASFHAKSNLLVTGFSNGLFALYELPDFVMLHSLSISQTDIDFVDINKSGEWLAFGASKLGQLLVWEWQSESYILKQQGHFDSMNALVYTPDAQRIVTCADDGKIKVWDVSSGFCIVTFSDHTSGVTACEFTKRGSVLFTSSLDGSVRAWDLVRYRNFRTFTSTERTSFSCIAVDPGAEVVCAGSLDSFDIHVWSVQTGQLLDQLAGHEGPVSSLAFSPDGSTLVSGSWDRTVRLWNIFARTQTSEPLQLMSDVLCVVVRPDSKQVAVSTLDGSLSFWSVTNALQEGGLEGRRDVSGGRRFSDRRTAANVAGTKSFTTLCYSADGSCVLAAGNSLYICLYDVQSAVLVKKYTVSVNLSLDGTQEILNSRNLTEAGPLALIDEQGDASDLEDRMDITLPGSKRGGDMSLRKSRPEVRVTSLAFAPTGRAFAAASTEGLLVYSLDETLQFDPFELDLTVTPLAIETAIDNQDFARALIMAFRINESQYIQKVYNQIRTVDVPLVARDIPALYLPRLLSFIALATDKSPHLELNLVWINSILRFHGRRLKEGASRMSLELRLIQRALKRIQTDLGRLADDNGFTIDYLLCGTKKLGQLEAQELTIERMMNGHATETPASLNL